MVPLLKKLLKKKRHLKEWTKDSSELHSSVQRCWRPEGPPKGSLNIQRGHMWRITYMDNCGKKMVLPGWIGVQRKGTWSEGVECWTKVKKHRSWGWNTFFPMPISTPAGDCVWDASVDATWSFLSVGGRVSLGAEGHHWWNLDELPESLWIFYLTAQCWFTCVLIVYWPKYNGSSNHFYRIVSFFRFPLRIPGWD